MRRIKRHLHIPLLFSITVVLLSLLAACNTMPTSVTPSTPSTLSQTDAIPQPSTQLPDFVHLVALVRPSVVAINIEVTSYDIYNRPIVQEGAGSGWILDDSGVVVTNNHVVQDARAITVTLHDGRVIAAELVGGDALSDIAVIKINAKDLKKIEVGDSSMLQAGEWVLTLGNSLGLGITAKEGIVSRVGVSLAVSAGQTIDDLVETSAAINPGNSGGPMVNMRGQVVGINSIKIATEGVEGMGYAISSETAIPIINELIKNGYVVRPWLGVSVREINESIAQYLKLAVNNGVLVVQVARNSPADKAGIEVGDVIVELDGKTIESTHDLRDAIHSSAIGNELEITYYRESEKKTTRTTLAESPAP